MSEEKKVVNAVMKQEKLEDIIAHLRSISVTDPISAICVPIIHAFADRIEAAWKREIDRLMSEPRSWEECVERAMKAKENSDVPY